MTFLNCDEPESPNGPIICKTCGSIYKMEYDTIKAPFNERGVLSCDCGVQLIKWRSTREPYLIKMNN
jgi:hypothetical protein